MQHYDSHTITINSICKAIQNGFHSDSTRSGNMGMQIEDYFNFLAEDDIRIKGTRIGIESVLYEYIHRSQTPEAIAEHFRTLTLEQVYATILYYSAEPRKSWCVFDRIIWNTVERHGRNMRKIRRRGLFVYVNLRQNRKDLWIGIFSFRSSDIALQN